MFRPLHIYYSLVDGWGVIAQQTFGFDLCLSLGMMCGLSGSGLIQNRLKTVAHDIVVELYISHSVQGR